MKATRILLAGLFACLCALSCGIDSSQREPTDEELWRSVPSLQEFNALRKSRDERIQQRRQQWFNRQREMLDRLVAVPFLTVLPAGLLVLGRFSRKLKSADQLAFWTWIVWSFMLLPNPWSGLYWLGFAAWIVFFTLSRESTMSAATAAHGISWRTIGSIGASAAAYHVLLLLILALPGAGGGTWGWAIESPKDYEIVTKRGGEVISSRPALLGDIEAEHLEEVALVQVLVFFLVFLPSLIGLLVSGRMFSALMATWLKAPWYLSIGLLASTTVVVFRWSGF